MDTLGHDRFWRIPFNRVDTVPEQLVKGREDGFFGYEFAIQGGKLPGELVDYYVRVLSGPGAPPGSFGFYRAFDATVAQNQQRKTRPLTMPVLATGGGASYIAGAGHWVAEQA